MRRISNWVLNIFIAILVLILLCLVLIQLPPVQNRLKNMILDRLSEQYGADFSIERIDIDFFDVVKAQNVRFMDPLGDTLFYATDVRADIGLFDLLNRKITIDQLKAENVISHIYAINDSTFNTWFLEKDDSGSTGTANARPWSFSMNRISLSNSRINYESPSLSMVWHQPELHVAFRVFDAEDRMLEISDLILEGTRLNINTPAQSNVTGNPGFSLPRTGWTLKLDHAAISGPQINYTSGDEDFMLKTLEAQLTNISLSDTLATGELDKLSVNTNMMADVQTLEGQFHISNNEILVTSFRLHADDNKANASRLSYAPAAGRLTARDLNAYLTYPFLQQFRKSLPSGIKLIPGRHLNITARNLSISPSSFSGDGLRLDYENAIKLGGRLSLTGLHKPGNLKVDASLDYFTARPVALDEMFSSFSIPDSLEDYRQIRASGLISGTMQTMNFTNFQVAIDQALSGSFSGVLTDMDKPENMGFDLRINRLESDIRHFPLPPNDQLALDSLGQVFLQDTRITGNRNRMHITGSLRSDLGGVQSDIVVELPRNGKPLRYKGELTTEEFELGIFLKNPNLSRLSISTSINGSGTDLNSITSQFRGSIQKFDFKGYTFHDITLNADLSERKLAGSLVINDPNLKLNYNGTIDFSGTRSVFEFTADLDTIAFAPLNLLPVESGLKATISSSFALPLRAGESGSLRIDRLFINNQNEKFYDDSILIAAHRTTDSTIITVRSGFADLEAGGLFSIPELPVVFERMIRYYMPGSSTPGQASVISESMHIKGHIISMRPLDLILPGTVLQLGKGKLDVALDFRSLHAMGSVSIDSFYLGPFFSEHIQLEAGGKDRILNTDITASNNLYNNISVPIIKLNNTFNGTNIQSTFVAQDEDRLPRLRFNSTLERIDEALVMSFRDSIILNQKDWLVSPDNLIRIDSNELLIRDFTLTDNSEYLSISSPPGEDDIIFSFENFNIAQFPTLLTSQPSKLAGHMNGDLHLRDFRSDVYFLVDLVVSRITYENSRVGELTISAEDDPITNIVTADFLLQGPRNDVEGTGTYEIPTGRIDFGLDIGSFEMKLFDPFLTEIIKNSEGIAQGEATLTGTLEKPRIHGRLSLNDVVTTIVANNARYGIDEHTIEFTNESIDIGELDIYDENNNLAVMTGKIHHNHLRDFMLDLELDTDEFIFLNTTAIDNPIFYGKMILNANAYIGGSPELMYVDAVAETLEGTNITISPFSETGEILKEEFITYGKPEDYEDLTSRYLLQLARRYPFDANILLNATDDAYMTFVVDPVRGDQIEGYGYGDLRLKLHPTGEQQFFGTYYVSEGHYSFSYSDIVSKEFDIKPGGSVTFNGNPLVARLDIDAVYNVYTTTYDLIQNEVSLTDNEIQAARTRTNVQVLLSLTGSLESPDIALDIVVPDLQSSSLVSTLDRKLNELRNDPNALNNQVFGLLLFDSFLQTDNATAGFNNIGNDIALSSISSLISSQLNNLANHLIKGVDINIDVSSYDSRYVNDGAGGNITEVGLQVSKKLFDDRLSVSAGGNFNLNGNPTIGNYSSFIGDFVLEYKLTESGQYRVRVFSRTEFDRLLYENSSKTGVSLFFSKPFDSKTDGK